MAILICGGAGYIGSHVNKQLHSEGYETVVSDNLIYGHREAVKWGNFVHGDLANIEDIEQAFLTYQIDAVIYLAAYAYAEESVSEPDCVTITEDKLRLINPYSVTKLLYCNPKECLIYLEQ